MCGGQSLRMGTDKGLIPIGYGSCWAAFMGHKLTAFKLPVCASINAGQLQSYSNYFTDEQLVVDSFSVGGPLNGLLSVHQKYPDDDLFLLACDVINMEPKTIQRLIDTYALNESFDFYAYQQQQYAEPLCAIYTGNGLKTFLNQHTPQQLQGLSMHKLLNQGNTCRLPVTEPDSFNNHNTM